MTSKITQHTSRPEEGHAEEIAQEQRRVADRQQAAADVADQEDEEDHRVHDVSALGVGLKQGPNQQHARPGGAHEACDRRADGQEGGVRGRPRNEVALEADAPADHVEAEEQDDERDVLDHDRVHEHADDGLLLVGHDHVEGDRRAGEPKRHAEPVQIVLPPVMRGGQQRQDRDAAEDADEGQDPQAPPRRRIVQRVVFRRVLERVNDEPRHDHGAAHEGDPSKNAET
jgi:hypothetical protein